MTVAPSPMRSRPTVRRRRDSRRALPFEHRPSLDGIRAVAALLVLLFHAGMPLFAHGYVGVDVFFVLSGFLITSLLARELIGTGRLSFVAFYARRARRLLPAALGVLLATAVAYELIASPLAIAENRGGFTAAALYFSNWFFLGQSRDYFAEEAHPSPVQHYWSLSVEEQFYLVWPLLVLGLVVLLRRYRLQLDAGAAVLAVAGMVYAGVLAAHDPMASYFGTPARAYQLLIGATIALLCLRWETAAEGAGSWALVARRSNAARAAGALLAAAGLALVLVAGTPWLSSGSAYWHGVVSALGAGALILGLEITPGSSTGRGLSWRPAQLLGRWSYAAYLWHWPVIILGDDAGVLPGAWVPRTIVVVVVTVLLSAGTFYAVERPAQRISLRTFPRRRLVAVCGVATAAVAAWACGSVLRIDSQVQAMLKEATAGPGATLAKVPKSAGGHAPTVLLIGDSHARALYPALADLAKAQGWSLVPVVEYGCPWARVAATLDDGRPLQDCDQFRANALQAAARRHPAVALLVSRAIVRRPLRVGDELLWPGDPGWLEAVTRGTEEFLAELRPLVGHVVITEPLSETENPMIECLAAGDDADSCSAPAVDAPGTAPLEAFWRGLPGVTTVSLDDLVCPDGVCPALVDGVLTHRDTNHLTESYAHVIAPALDEFLRMQGVVLATGKARAPA